MAYIIIEDVRAVIRALSCIQDAQQKLKEEKLPSKDEKFSKLRENYYFR